jgi:predicted Fe-S protein YdhL (DUF1289 family)
MIAFPAAMRMFAFCPRLPESMTIATRPPSVESPCTKICTVDPVSRLCFGCGRSLAEIANWLGFSNGERARIMAELPGRRASLQRLDSPQRANSLQRSKPTEPI